MEQAPREPNAQEKIELARFASELGLPPGTDQQLQDAAAAIRQESRDSSRWKRFACSKVSVFAERDRGAIYMVHVGQTIEFDWTWEGARAFCPRSRDDEEPSSQLPPGIDCDQGVTWSGEIVEVDEQNGCLFLVIDDPEAVPTPGDFLVRPFEFMSVIDAIYNAPEYQAVRKQLPSRLNATTGNIHPPVAHPAQLGLDHLREWWQHAWSILWGPPGTGKTWTTGQQIGRVLSDERERILVVSTTNKATDAVALSLGEAAQQICRRTLEAESLLRIGKGASYQSFAHHQLDAMLAGTETETLSQIDQLAHQLKRAETWEEKALARKQIAELRSSSNDLSNHVVVDARKRVIITTAFKALRFLREGMICGMVERGEAPFTTIFIDEAGLISRTTVAALSLLAARRVVLVGDSKQLAPISRICRVLPTRQQTWLASSGLSHLEETDSIPPAVTLLTEQRRMHPDICQVVSAYQYHNVLTTAADRQEQSSRLPGLLANQSRTLWYVLDEEDCELDEIRASRGPNHRSWIREITRDVLQKLFHDHEIRKANGLFISPFRAQAQATGTWLAEWEMQSWEASTVHRQQGSEADVVVFDPVHAGSHTWGIAEWKRLVNVALSRAREAIIVLASRSEMEEPYLRPLRTLLQPVILVESEGQWKWRNVGAEASSSSALQVAESMPTYAHRRMPPKDGGKAGKAGNRSSRIGDQLADRRDLQPVLSREQQRLTQLKLDGKPRLVRGVAGSGKSLVLCNWLATTVKRLQGKQSSHIWAVYANRSLRKLLCDSIEAAWRDQQQGELFDRTEFPWHQVELLHVRDVLQGLLSSMQMSIDEYGFDYDRAAEAFLQSQRADQLLPRCSALFIDEAQDMGPSTLRLLLSVVEPSDQDDTNSRPAHIFYDDAQNVYGTRPPKWSDFGLDMRGRSTIMRESFRSTRPITELAVNVLHRLSGGVATGDQQELVSLGLLKTTQRQQQTWLEVEFNQVDGPHPIFRRYENRDVELGAIARHLKHLIQVDGITPNDICILYNGNSKQWLESKLAPQLAAWGVELSIQTNRAFQCKSNTLLATTPHSYKGYESEVVVIPCVDRYVGSEGKILAKALYVAMTRARSLLAMYGMEGGSGTSRHICDTIAACIQAMQS